MKSNVMRIIAERGRKDLAKVYIGLMKNCSESYLVEFVESIQPPIRRDENRLLLFLRNSVARWGV
jgi:hypothetical protein